MKTLLRYTFLPFLTVLIIFIATCLLTPTNMPSMPEGLPWDKLVHFGMFFTLSAVSLIDYYRMHSGTPSKIRWIFWGFVIPVIYGGVIELMQKYLFASRSAEFADWIADILGSLIATVVIVIFYSRQQANKKILEK